MWEVHILVGPVKIYFRVGLAVLKLSVIILLNGVVENLLGLCLAGTKEGQHLPIIPEQF